MTPTAMQHAQFQLAIAAAKRRFAEIQRKYPGLKAVLVLSLPGEQTGIDSAPLDILKEFPGMVVENPSKTAARALLHGSAKAGDSAALGKRLNELAAGFEYNPRAQVELRFRSLDFELIWALQTDPLVDRALTPHSKASIRIVLGTLSDFLTTTTTANAP